ncbi:MAG: TadE/TadG family type IV pilus assembly protein [Pyrinomonadaceae bacterium]
MKRIRHRTNERGATLVEFAIGATVFLIVMFAVIEFGRALWVHNALTDAARRGARYAVCHSQADAPAVVNVVIYGNPAGGTNPVVNDLTTANVQVDYSEFGLSGGTATVSITGYQFQFVLPLVSPSIAMPNYKTTLTAESAGLTPTDL